MRLGTLELTARPVDTLHSAALSRAAAISSEPGTSILALVALGLSASGPSDWPTFDDRVSDFQGYGRVIRSYLQIRGVDLRDAVLVGGYALRAIRGTVDISMERANEIADFFGVRRDFEPASISPDDTKALSSEG